MADDPVSYTHLDVYKRQTQIVWRVGDVFLSVSANHVTEAEALAFAYGVEKRRGWFSDKGGGQKGDRPDAKKNMRTGPKSPRFSQ